MRKENRQAQQENKESDKRRKRQKIGESRRVEVAKRKLKRVR